MIQTRARGAVMLFPSSWLWRRREGASTGKPLSPLVTMPWRNQDFTECALDCKHRYSSCAFESLGWEILHRSRKSQKPLRCSVTNYIRLSRFTT